MKTYRILNNKFKLFVKGDEIGINASSAVDLNGPAQHWYWFGKWSQFKNEVEAALDHSTQFELESVSDEQLLAEMNRRLGK